MLILNLIKNICNDYRYKKNIKQFTNICERYGYIVSESNNYLKSLIVVRTKQFSCDELLSPVEYYRGKTIFIIDKNMFNSNDWMVSVINIQDNKYLNHNFDETKETNMFIEIMIGENRKMLIKSLNL